VEDLNEKEQLDALRAWWSENGSFVMGGIFVGILIIFGWNRWQTGIADSEIAASTLFEDVMEAVGRGNLDVAAEASGELFSGYNDSPYAGQARLAMARMYMDNGRDQDAADVLTPLAELAPKNELALIGRLRLAKILLYQDKAQEVVDLIKGQPETAFTPRFNEVLGDAYVALESYADAEAAYMAALSDNPASRTVDVALIQLKINDLPAANEVDAATPAVAPGTSAEEELATEVSAAEGVATEAQAPDVPPAESAADSEPETE
jgi:predicted negative regulator of RcsB-dependent stress response